jgi:purine catabolism regulator
VHISELEDPTQWLSGGELLLTTGIQIKGAAQQRRFLALLADRGVAGLGLGTGFEHKRLPKALVDEASKRDIPLFEVPYEMPFIAITERAFARLVNEQYAVLERGAQVHERLERLVIEGSGLAAIIGSIASAIGGSAIVQDATGRELARHPSKGGPGAAALKALGEEIASRRASSALSPFEPQHQSLAGRALAVPVPGRRGGAPVAWLTVVSKRAPLGDFERLAARQGSMVVGLELMRERVVRETERRLAGDLLVEALGGRLDSDELRGRLRPFGIGAEAAVLVFELEDPHAGEGALELELANAGIPALVATSAAAGRPLLCAVIDPRAGDPVDVAGSLRSALAGTHGQVRAAASRSAAVGSLRRAFHEARCALEATALADGGAPEVASHQDLGAFTLLLSLQDEDALRLYSDGLLEPIERTEGEYGGELLRSLEAYIEHNGNWERAARQLYCHRHTLRYRIRKVEELTGRDLSRATDRIELWLALRARELVT